MFTHDFHFNFDYDFINPKQPTAISLINIGVKNDLGHNQVQCNNKQSTNTYIFQYTLEGSGIVKMNGTKHVFHKNDAFLLFTPNNIRYYTNPESEFGWRYLYLTFRVEEDIKEYCSEIIDQTGGFFVLSPNSIAMKSVISIVTKRRAGLLNHSVLACSAAYNFISNLYYETTQNNQQYSIHIQDTIRIMEERFVYLEGIFEIADTLNISASHLTREFSKEVGIPPIKYITNLRLNHALSLLRESNFSINKIAELSGFSNGGYFTRIFKKHLDILPTEFRFSQKSAEGELQSNRLH